MDPEVKRKVERSFDELWDLIEIEQPSTIDGLRHMMRVGWTFAAGELLAPERVYIYRVTIERSGE